MRVLITTDGSKQSLTAARHFKSFADPERITDISVLAVVSPLASVSFADELSPDEQWAHTSSFRQAAQNAVSIVAAEFTDWGPAVSRRIRSGSPPNEIIKAARQLGAGLVVIASGGRGVTESVLVGSTAQRVQQYAPCPVLVVRPTPRRRRPRGR